MTELFTARLSFVSKLKWLHWKKNWQKSDVFISVKFFVVAWDRPLTFAYILWRHSVTEPMRSILGDLCYKVIHLQTMLNLYGKLFDVKPQHCLILRIFLHVLSNEHRIIIKKHQPFKLLIWKRKISKYAQNTRIVFRTRAALSSQLKSACVNLFEDGVIIEMIFATSLQSHS